MVEARQVLGLAQSDTLLTITGQSGDETTVTAYADILRASSLFGNVVIQSITLKSGGQSRNTNAQAAPTPQPEAKYVEFVLTVEIQQGQSQ